MSNKYPSSYVISSAADVRLVREALIFYQEQLRKDAFDSIESSCFDLCKLNVDLMISNKNLIMDIDKHIEFDDFIDCSILNNAEASSDVEDLE